MSRPDTPDRPSMLRQASEYLFGAHPADPVGSVDGQAVETPPSSKQNRSEPVAVAGRVSGFDSLIAAPELLIEVRVAADAAWRSWRIGDAVTLSPPPSARVDGETECGCARCDEARRSAKLAHVDHPADDHDALVSS